ncbi:MAG: FUSC family protein, partial [Thermoleophilia bacterium]
DDAAEMLANEIGPRPLGEQDPALVSEVATSFRLRALSLAAREIGGNAMRAAGLGRRELHASSALDASMTVARGYVNPRTVLLRNSVRGAAALAIAVLIAQHVSLQHSFWIVLGTLSVLRSNALGTGARVMSALGGTAVGLLIGVGLVSAIGTHEAVLWVTLPPAVLLAAYAPQAISFAAGQAGFTITLLILFNIIQPTGWTVGLVRIEDVTIGFAISLVVGALFWPRGAAALMRRNLASSYASSAEYIAAAVQHLIRGSDVTRARRQARAAADRLDDDFRQLLGELAGDRKRLEGLAVLLTGATRLRLAADSLWSLADGTASHAPYVSALDAEVRRIRSWYSALADALGDGRMPPPSDDDPERQMR